MQLIVALFVAALIRGSAAQLGAIPSGIERRPLDVGKDFRRADLVLLARPITVREIRILPVDKLAEIEVTLRVMKVVKGSNTADLVQFTFYSPHGEAQIGPPQGAVEGVGISGIFFLRRTGEGSLRSAVDVFRPEISTRWIRAEKPSFKCLGEIECVLQVLLSWQDDDDARSFVAALPRNVAWARLISPQGTLSSLKQLTNTGSAVDIARAACREIAGWFPSELPERCRKR